MDKLFGDGDEKLVSREQLANFAYEVYTSFHVYAEYESRRLNWKDVKS